MAIVCHKISSIALFDATQDRSVNLIDNLMGSAALVCDLMREKRKYKAADFVLIVHEIEQ